ncbi:hypothetical protein [Methylocucumis oryzae]|uniref:hypothetical protein n=1 Tax=Methylocucumis oryzae TaxID=1632867 RepID=UPI000A5B648A|nr:hypothetical protein [Methylocucumis oryzae]
MRDEYDFSNAQRAYEVPHLAKLQGESGKTRITIFLDTDIFDRVSRTRYANRQRLPNAYQ